MDTTEYSNLTTSKPITTDDVNGFNELVYLIAPLAIIILIFLFSAIVYLMARKRRIDKLRVRLLSLYEFDSNEQEWESLNEYDKSNYKSMDYTTTVL